MTKRSIDSKLTITTFEHGVMTKNSSAAQSTNRDKGEVAPYGRFARRPSILSPRAPPSERRLTLRCRRTQPRTLRLTRCVPQGACVRRLASPPSPQGISARTVTVSRRAPSTRTGTHSRNLAGGHLRGGARLAHSQEPLHGPDTASVRDGCNAQARARPAKASALRGAGAFCHRASLYNPQLRCFHSSSWV